ncbi:MAG: YdeI/OmpD-associated family protein [Flavobacteriales bacterium]
MRPSLMERVVLPRYAGLESLIGRLGLLKRLVTPLTTTFDRQESMSEPIVNTELLLQKIPGKGGWTYAEMPDIPQRKDTPFGWRRVRGFIDDYELKQFHLMPMGNGRLFLSVKKEIRKAIGKEAGDTVHVRLWPDDSPVETPDELKECLEVYDGLYEQFQALNQGERKYYLEWIYGAKQEETKAKRINTLIDDLQSGETIYKRSAQ